MLEKSLRCRNANKLWHSPIYLARAIGNVRRVVPGEFEFFKHHGYGEFNFHHVA